MIIQVSIALRRTVFDDIADIGDEFENEYDNYFSIPDDMLSLSCITPISFLEPLTFLLNSNMEKRRL